MNVYTVTQADRFGRPATAAPSRKYRAATPEDAARLYVDADGHEGHQFVGSHMGRYTFNPTTVGSPVTVLVTQAN